MKKNLGVVFLTIGCFVFILSSCGENQPTTLVSTDQSSSIGSDNNDPSKNKSDVVDNELESVDYEGEDDEEYLKQSDFKNQIDDYMVARVNAAGMNGSQAELRENEDVFFVAWKEEYNSIVKHMIKKCKNKSDKSNIKKMKKSFETYLKNTREALELEIISGYEKPKNMRNSLRGNGTRSRLNLIEGQLYRDACVTYIKNMEDGDEYTIKFGKKEYNSIKEELKID